MLQFLKVVFRAHRRQPNCTMPENPDYDEVIAVIDEVLRYLRLPDCDVAWSHFSTAKEAIDTVAALAARVRAMDRAAIDDLDTLFAPTGALQEISISSGWGEEYLSLSQRFDIAIGKPV